MLQATDQHHLTDLMWHITYPNTSYHLLSWINIVE